MVTKQDKEYVSRKNRRNIVSNKRHKDADR